MIMQASCRDGSIVDVCDGGVVGWRVRGVAGCGHVRITGLWIDAGRLGRPDTGALVCLEVECWDTGDADIVGWQADEILGCLADKM